MKAFAFVAAVGLAFAAVPALGQQLAPQAVLNGSVVASGSYLHLGDIFRNVGDKTDAVVAYAPAPGKQFVLDTRTLMHLARAHQLDWRPLSPQDHAVVRRDSHVIDRDEIEAQVLAALAAKGAGDNLRLSFSNTQLRIHVPADLPAEIAVEDLTHDSRSGRFSATIVAPAGHPAAERVRVSGRVHEVSEIPVLARNKSAHQPIGENDIEWVKVRADRVYRDTVVEAEHLIGMVPRRSLRAGTPIRLNEVRRQVLVAKGSIVTMALAVPGMSLTAQGRAQEDGSSGETIRVLNVSSNTVIEAVVDDTGRVIVAGTNRTPGRLAAN